MIVCDNFLTADEWQNFTIISNWFKRFPNTWMDFGQTPRNPYEQLSTKIWKWYDPNHSCVGYEYWTNINTPDNVLGWHIDKDENHFSKTDGELLTPRLGCVLYGQHMFMSGGYLEIEHSDGIERIKALPNRLIIFPAYLKHRVSDIYEGQRFTFASNIWDMRIDLQEYK